MFPEPMMTYDEVGLARRIIGLRRTAYKARGNGWTPRRVRIADRPLIERMTVLGYVETTAPGFWRMTGNGIQQLKLQMGEFTFRART